LRPDSSEESDARSHEETNREDVVERLACMLEASIKVTHAFAGEETRYVAAMPGTLPHGEGNAMRRWYMGFLGFWDSNRSFVRGARPVSSCPLTSIVKIETSPTDSAVVLLRSQEVGKFGQGGPPGEFELGFATSEEARLWASSLLALIEQLRDKAALGTLSG